MKKIVYIVLAIPVLLLAMCCTDNTEVALPEEYNWIDTINLGHQIKGYEIYSWQEDTEWNFNLIYGTNRSKICDEIKEYKFYNEGAADYKVKGVSALKGLLSKLPSGEFVFWSDGKLINNEESKCDDISLPEKAVINEIDNFCKQKGVELIVSYQ